LGDNLLDVSQCDPGGAGERGLAVPPHLHRRLAPAASFVARSRGPAGGLY